MTKKGSTPVMTVPVTPQLVSRTRSRPQHIPSQQEIEEQEVEEMKKYINSNELCVFLTRLSLPCDNNIQIRVCQAGFVPL